MTATTDYLDHLLVTAISANNLYRQAVDARPNVSDPLPDTTVVRAADDALEAAAEALVSDEIKTALDLFMELRDECFRACATDDDEARFRVASDALWALLSVRDDEAMPRVTIRACCPGKTCDPTTILLASEPDGMVSYRRASNQDLFFEPTTVEGLHELLRDDLWRP